MGLETGTYISDLVSTNPVEGDNVSTTNDHLWLLKSTIKTTFPNVSGAVTPTHTQLNYVAGVTSALQTQMDLKAALASPTLTGTPAAPTAAAGTNTTQLATTAFVTASNKGQWIKLLEQTAAGDTAIDFKNGTGGVVISSTYKDYLVVFDKLKVSADNSRLYMRYSTDAGATFNAGATNYKTQYLYGSSTSAVAGATSTTEFYLSAIGIGNVAAAEDGISGTLEFSSPADVERFSVRGVLSFQDTSTQLTVVTVAGQTDTDEDVDAIRFLPSGGNFASGKITLYGRNI